MDVSASDMYRLTADELRRIVSEKGIAGQSVKRTC